MSSSGSLLLFCTA